MNTKRKMKRKPTTGQPSKGLGDDIEKVLESPAIKPITESIKKLVWGESSEDCGCDERKELLNKLFPKNRPNCFTKEQYEDWTEISGTIKKTGEISHENQTKIIMYLRSILNMSVSGDGCRNCSASIWKKYIDLLDKVASTYKEIE